MDDVCFGRTDAAQDTTDGLHGGVCEARPVVAAAAAAAEVVVVVVVVIVVALVEMRFQASLGEKRRDDGGFCELSYNKDTGFKKRKKKIRSGGCVFGGEKEGGGGEILLPR